MKWDIWNSADYRPPPGREGKDSLLDAVLRARGIASPEEAAAFLSADLSRLHNPLLMKDMPQGAARIRRAIETSETVAVYGDYDADGITASALMVSYLRSKGLPCLVYIPDRLEEGYGLSKAALASLKEAGAQLVITVDCGVSAVDVVRYANTLGLDLVITDHHQCPGEMPPAVAVINPKRPDCPYPDKNLAGVGVAFQCIRAVEGAEHTEALLARYGDLVAVGTVADVMDLVGENRTFVTEGLKSLRSGARAGFHSLILQAGLTKEPLDASGISYGLAPRINAAGRMGETMLAFSLLETSDLDEAAKLADALCRLNGERQKIEQVITEDVLAALEAQGYEAGPIVLASEGWHKGVLGIVSARLAERYQEPVILISIQGDKGEGSCRSVAGFDLFSALAACEDCLERFGGHPSAAGLTLAASEIQRLKAAFGVYYRENPPAGERILEADFTLTDPRLLGLEQVTDLERLEPCGKGNPNPILLLEGATLLSVQPIGGGKHVKLQVKKWNQVYSCVFFAMTAEDLGAEAGDCVDLAFSPQCNRFRGKTSVQLLIRDLAKTERRLTAKARKLCAQLLANTHLDSIPFAEEAARITPGREDFVRLWRLLKRDEAARSGGFHQLLDELTLAAQGIENPAKTYLCLQILNELGLARVRERADMLSVELLKANEKVDLNASRVLGALQNAMEQ